MNSDAFLQWHWYQNCCLTHFYNAQFTHSIWQVFLWKILLPGNFLLFLLGGFLLKLFLLQKKTLSCILPSRKWHLVSRLLGIETFFQLFESIGIDLDKFGLEKKSQYQSRKILVSKKVSASRIYGLLKSLGMGLKFGSQKSLSIGLGRFGLKKSICNGLKKVLVFHIFQDRKWECNLILLKL